MDAAPLLRLAAKLLAKHKLDAVLIGNAAAALHGAPVTTMDIDFMMRETSGNVRKLRAIARDLDAVILKPFYPVSYLYRLSREGTGLQFDFMTSISGIRSFEGLRARGSDVEFAGHTLRIAALEDIIRSKEAANRPQDRAVLPVIRRVVREQRPVYGSQRTRRRR